MHNLTAAVLLLESEWILYIVALLRQHTAVVADQSGLNEEMTGMFSSPADSLKVEKFDQQTNQTGLSPKKTRKNSNRSKTDLLQPPP